MPTITVLTPVHEGGYTYIRELYECLRGQKLPAHWSLEWVVQEDGRKGIPLEAVPDAPWISKGAGRWGGAAQARTLGLARATGTLLRCIDSDDLLPDEMSLYRDIEVLEANPAYGWTVAPCLDLRPDGRLERGPYDPGSGLLPERALLDGAKRGALPVMGTTLTARSDLVRVVGGWPAIPAFEDAALLLFCEAVSRGWMQAEPGELYRKHPGQHTASAAYHDEEEKKLRQEIALNRAEALHASGWRWQPGASPDVPRSRR
ncbi:glycosyltransferase family 2 protein [Streptomyces sp. NPDC048489]|uniref:glycosyltransferase family 2 protein n=1 Tax=Streptomyces sp. NPDC048489 TaxID=3154504 RepID=UPI003420BE56